MPLDPKEVEVAPAMTLEHQTGGEGESCDLAEVERAWIAEAERRYQEYLAGGVEVIPASQALAEARAALRGM